MFGSDGGGHEMRAMAVAVFRAGLGATDAAIDAMER